ncbi:hypothetical protein CBF45_07470 [Bordetella sp. J329]|nr:hypothetical protein CBF45_07470 [Bordetella sp. J329]
MTARPIWRTLECADRRASCCAIGPLYALKLAQVAGNMLSGTLFVASLAAVLFHPGGQLSQVFTQFHRQAAIQQCRFVPFKITLELVFHSHHAPP